MAAKKDGTPRAKPVRFQGLKMSITGSSAAKKTANLTIREIPVRDFLASVKAQLEKLAIEAAKTNPPTQLVTVKGSLEFFA